MRLQIVCCINSTRQKLQMHKNDAAMRYGNLDRSYSFNEHHDRKPNNFFPSGLTFDENVLREWILMYKGFSRQRKNCLMLQEFVFVVVVTDCRLCGRENTPISSIANLKYITEFRQKWIPDGKIVWKQVSFIGKLIQNGNFDS